MHGKVPISRLHVKLWFAVDISMPKNIQGVVQADLQLLESLPGTGLKSVLILVQTGTKELFIELPAVAHLLIKYQLLYGLSSSFLVISSFISGSRSMSFRVAIAAFCPILDLELFGAAESGTDGDEGCPDIEGVSAIHSVEQVASGHQKSLRFCDGASRRARLKSSDCTTIASLVSSCLPAKLFF